MSAPGGAPADQCIFCKIIAGQIPAKKIYEDDKCLAVLDINPLNLGHVILMPKEHQMILPQIPDETVTHLGIISKKIAAILFKAIKPTGVNIFMANGAPAGQKAPHFMVHIIPRYDGDGAKCFELPEKEPGDLNGVYEKLKAVMGGAGGAQAQPQQPQQPQQPPAASGQPAPVSPAQGAQGGQAPQAGQQLGRITPSMDQYVQFINSNPQLKELLLNDRNLFKQAVAQHDQLKELFKSIDLDKLADAVGGKKQEAEDKVDLDAIGSVLSGSVPKSEPAEEKVEAQEKQSPAEERLQEQSPVPIADPKAQVAPRKEGGLAAMFGGEEKKEEQKEQSNKEEKEEQKEQKPQSEKQEQKKEEQDKQSELPIQEKEKAVEENKEKEKKKNDDDEEDDDDDEKEDEKEVDLDAISNLFK